MTADAYRVGVSTLAFDEHWQRPCHSFTSPSEPAAAEPFLSAAARAWEPADEQESHRMVVFVGAGFEAPTEHRAHEAVRRHPATGISLSSQFTDASGSAVALAATAGYGWVEAIAYHQFDSRALILPRDLAADFAQYLRSWGSVHHSYSSALHDFLQLGGIRVNMTVPRPSSGEAATEPAADRADDVLELFPLCPYLLNGVAYALVRHSDGSRVAWRHLHWTVIAGRLGLETNELRRAYQGSAASGLAAGLASNSLREYAFSLWLTAFLMACVPGLSHRTQPASVQGPGQAQAPDLWIELAKAGIAGSNLTAALLEPALPQLGLIALAGQSHGLAIDPIDQGSAPVC